MRRSVHFVVGLAAVGVLALAVVGMALGEGPAGGEPGQAVEGGSGETAGGPSLETLLRAELEGIAGTEVIVSRVRVPPHTALPRHWHPGEEFAYVLEGSVVLWQEGRAEIRLRAGDVVEVPLRQVHTAMTEDEAATILVFRVHEQGAPERTLVEPASSD